MIVNRTARRAGGGLPAAGELLERELDALWDDPRADTSTDRSALVTASDRDTANDADLDPGSRAWLSNGSQR